MIILVSQKYLHHTCIYLLQPLNHSKHLDPVGPNNKFLWDNYWGSSHYTGLATWRPIGTSTKQVCQQPYKNIEKNLQICGASVMTESKASFNKSQFVQHFERLKDFVSRDMTKLTKRVCAQRRQISLGIRPV